MKSIASNPKSAAIIGFILCLPITILFSLFLLDIEPNFGPLRSLLIANESHLASILAFGLMLLLPVAFIINIMPIRQGKRAGNNITAYRINLLLAIAILSLMIWIVGSIIVDQYPCWIGVPNCD